LPILKRYLKKSDRLPIVIEEGRWIAAE